MVRVGVINWGRRGPIIFSGRLYLQQTVLPCLDRQDASWVCELECVCVVWLSSTTVVTGSNKMGVGRAIGPDNNLHRELRFHYPEIHLAVDTLSSEPVV